MDILPKIALKRAGNFIMSLEPIKDTFKWIKNDTRQLSIENPIAILMHAYKKANNDPLWTEKHKSTFRNLMKELESGSFQG